MHNDFADWYRGAHIEPTAALLEQRWKGVESYCAGVHKTQLVDLLRRACIESAAEPAGFREAFKNEDAAFTMRGNDNEMTVLAVACLRYLIDEKSELGDAAALGLVAAAGVTTQDMLSKEHLEAARAWIVDRARQLRNPSAVEDIVPLRIKKGQTDAVPQLAEAVQASFTSLATAVEQLSTAMTIQREESNILWWLVGGCSRTLGEPFHGVDFKRLLTLLPIEFAELVEIVPGPLSSIAILAEVLHRSSPKRANRRTTIREAVENADSAVLVGIKNTEVASLVPLTPVLHLLLQHREHDGPGWVDKCKDLAGVGLDEPMSTAQVVAQVFNELMFVRAISGTRDE